MIVFTSCSQDLQKTEVPSVVLNTFNSTFTDPQDVEWEKKGEFYEVEYEVEGVDMEAMISDSGILLKYKQEIEFNALPEVLKSSLQDRFSRRAVDDIHLLVIDDQEYYQVEVDGRLTSSHQVFHANGEQARDIAYYN